MMSTIERRQAQGDVELRAADDGAPVAFGYAAVFNRRSLDLGGFTEVIDRNAFAKTVTEADVVGLWNHDEGRLLGRVSSGTLRLSTDDRGLAYEIDLPDTADGRDVAVLLGRGDVRGSSFGFRVIRDEWHQDDQGAVTRTLLEVALIDVSPVARPAYPDTDAAVRSLAAAIHTDPADVRAAIEAGDLGHLIPSPEGTPPESQEGRRAEPTPTRQRFAHAY